MASTTFKGAGNNVAGTLSAAIIAGDLTCTLQSGEGAEFASYVPCWATLFEDDVAVNEVVLCTLRSTDTITITRAQQSTAASAWGKNTNLQLLMTAQNLTDVQDAINNIEDGTTELATVTATGNVLVGNSGTGSNLLSVDGADEEVRGMLINTAGSPRWAIAADDTAQAGGDVGSDLVFLGYDNTGTIIGAYVTISRATSDVTLSGDLTVQGGSLDVTNSETTGLLVQGTSWTRAVIESTGVGTDARLDLKNATAAWSFINDESDSNKLLIQADTVSRAYIDTTGNFWVAADCSALTLTVGGGYGSTGSTLSAAGDLSMNGDLAVDGAIEATGIHDDGGTGADGAIASGTYTPTISAGANVASSSAAEHSWHRVGQVVTIQGEIIVTPTAGATYTYVRITIPVASNFANSNECTGGGSVNVSTASITPAMILGEATQNKPQIAFISASTAAHKVRYVLQYQVI